MKIIKPRGTQDFYPPFSNFLWELKKKIIKILEKNNYNPILFPTFEKSELFTNPLNDSIIFNKEMFSFQDKKMRNLSLRPEGTISTARLISENKLLKENYPLKFYYWANMFRYERPQKDRYREFWQLGVELVNSDGIIADFQILSLIYEILINLNIKYFSISLNYIGNEETKKKYENNIKNYIKNNNIFENLCVNCKVRFFKNPLRISDCFSCKLKFKLPNYNDSWSKEDKKYVYEINSILDNHKFPYKYDYNLVRGLDYYNGLVFEVNFDENKAIIGGGRYNNLYKKIINLDAPSIGFSIGIDRLMNHLLDLNVNLIKKPKIDIFFFVSSFEFYEKIFSWKKKLSLYSLILDYNQKIEKICKIKKFIKYYDPRFFIILGKKELKNEIITIKKFNQDKNIIIKEKNFLDELINLFKKNNLEP